MDPILCLQSFRPFPPTVMGSWLKQVVMLVAVLLAASLGIMRLSNYGFVWTEEHMETYNRLQDCRDIASDALAAGIRVAPSEDLQVDLESNTLVTGVSDLQQSMLKYPSPKFSGSSPRYDISSSSWSLPKIVSGPPTQSKSLLASEWNPAGLSLFRTRDPNSGASDLLLFAISYNRTVLQSDWTVGILRYNPDLAVYEQQHRFKHQAIVAPNDIAPISPTEFYLTNFQTGLFAGTPIGNVLDLLGYGTANVIYCNVLSGECKTVLSDLTFSNSLVLSADGKHLYLSETTPKRVLVYAVDQASKELSLVDTIMLDSFLDNMNVDKEGRIWVAGTMDFIATALGIFDSTGNSDSAPCMAYRITPKFADFGFERPRRTTFESEHHWVEIMFVDNGRTISPLTSVAPSADGKVFLSSFANHKLVQCDVVE